MAITKKIIGNGPVWFARIVKDLKRTVENSSAAFTTPGVILNTIEDDDDNLTGYIIRLKDGGAGYFPITHARPTPVGVRVKTALPEPEFRVKEVDKKSFIYQTVRGQINSLPPMWLHATIKKIEDKVEIPKSSKSFRDFIQMPQKYKASNVAMEAIQKSVEWQGLRGLARFNDLNKEK